MVKYLLRKKGIPILEVEYPEDEEDARRMVAKIKEFLEGLK
jgi:putative methanogenesis marker protein 5